MIVLVLGSVALSIAGLLVVRKYVPHDSLLGHHDVAGYMLSVLGTLYAIILGLIVVNALNTFQTARATVDQEANALHDIFHIANGLPEPNKQELRKSCLAYAEAMISDEWPSMQTGRTSLRGHDIFQDILRSGIGFQPENNAQDDLHQALLGEIDSMNDLRHTRLTVAQPEFDAIIWGVLIIGGVVLVVFTYFFGVERLSIQIVMTAMVTLVLGINLTLVGMFGYPYSGDVHVSAQPFLNDITAFKSEMAGQR